MKEGTMAKKNRKSTEEGKEPSVLDKFLNDPEDTDDANQLASLLDPETGEIKGDFSMPKEFEVEIMAQQMVDHLTTYKQLKKAYIAAKNQGDHKRRGELFQQMRFSQVTVAMIQFEFPAAKEIADEIMQVRVAEVRRNRESALPDDED